MHTPPPPPPRPPRPIRPLDIPQPPKPTRGVGSFYQFGCLKCLVKLSQAGMIRMARCPSEGNVVVSTNVFQNRPQGCAGEGHEATDT